MPLYYTREERKHILDTLLYGIVRLRESMRDSIPIEQVPLIEPDLENFERWLRPTSTPIIPTLTPEEELLSSLTLEDCQRYIHDTNSAWYHQYFPSGEHRIAVIPPLGPIDVDSHIGPADCIRTVTLTLEQLRNRRDELLQTQESPDMATTYRTDTTTSTAAPIRFFDTVTTAYAAARPARNTIFQMKQNSHEIELRRLREKYNSIVFTYDFTLPPRDLFADERARFKFQCKALRRVIAARHVILTTPAKHLKHLSPVLEGNFTSRELQYILFDGPTPPSINTTRNYREVLERLNDLRINKSRYKDYKQRFGAQQAEHNQRAAMIRQKPERYISIDMQQVADTLATWDNVWGVTYYISNADKAVYLRIGLCNITMEESAQESNYENPQPILLAPFYITVKLSSIGRAICATREGNTVGLSRTNNPGHLSHDIHPHQLSDQPCFGTFGQPLVDMANNGDLISYVGTLIAFYSQYNSQDSAGVNARYLHPTVIQPIANIGEYKHSLLAGLRRYNSAEAHIDLEKLNATVAEYNEYHRTTNAERDSIRFAEHHICHSCDEADISNEQDYYTDHNGNRICPRCWDHYCGNCERHQEDCRCEPDEDED